MSNVAFFHDRLQLRSRGRILLIFICFKRISVSITVQITPRGRSGALCGRTRLWFGLLSCQYLFRMLQPQEFFAWFLIKKNRKCVGDMWFACYRCVAVSSAYTFPVVLPKPLWRRTSCREEKRCIKPVQWLKVKHSVGSLGNQSLQTNGWPQQKLLTFGFRTQTTGLWSME